MKPIAVASFFFILPVCAESPDVDNGAFLHGDHCIECHMLDDHEALYTRTDALPTRFRLNGQVSACVQVLDLGWFPEEEQDVAEYLDQTYYRFNER